MVEALGLGQMGHRGRLSARQLPPLLLWLFEIGVEAPERNWLAETLG